MVSIATFTEMALAYEEAGEQPHFHKSSFRVRKKIFATLDSQENTVVLKLSNHEQSVFADLAPGIIKPVKGSWGEKGWTEIDLENVSLDILKYALTTSYCRVAPKTLAAKYATSKS
ncbi:MAG: MmcQ/YjbR family DNA-binding protein [Acidimicrobiales bacterium]|nr:MmcQ/YjbR family DNA-binding protein [Hyphomonadaceae bacterium]RZV34839.1 MAG: MmcQ/YjbR family DNA-binding protein [Acidimicrobiales bacterium]